MTGTPDLLPAAELLPAAAGSAAVAPTVWLLVADAPLRQSLGDAFERQGWQVSLATDRCTEVFRHCGMLSPEARPELILSSLLLDDGDALQLMRHMADLPEAPALVLVSWQQRAVIRSAQALAEACGMCLAAAVELPAQPDAIVTQALAGLADCRRQRQRRRAAPAPAPLLGAADLRELLDRRAIQPHFQPKLRLDSREITGFEALMRARDAGGQLITPDRLITPLLQHGLLGEATLQLARQTVEFVAGCLLQGLSISASINVSLSLMSDPAFGRALVLIVEQAGLDPSWITIEITESEAMADLATVIEQTARVRMHGFNLSIDDFGTAYSSFFQLSQIPFSELKVERAFIKDLDSSPTARAIVGTCAHLGRALGLGVVAEGVETPVQLKAVMEAGYTVAQGYLIARPMPAEQALDWLARLQASRDAPVLRRSGFARFE